MSKTFVHNLGAFLRTTGAVVAVGFLPLVLPASGPWRGVPFDRWREVGRELDADARCNGFFFMVFAHP